jgi:hypothetical protein
VDFGYYKVGNLRRDGYLQLFIFEGNGMVDAGLFELVEKILWAVSFITIGGTVAVMFFFVFAQSIFGSKTIHSQLELLLRQNRQICEQLKQIAQYLEKEDKKPKKPEK